VKPTAIGPWSGTPGRTTTRPSNYEEAIRLAPKATFACIGLAWLLATCPVDKARDGNRAVELATRCCELTDWKSANALDTLAAAHAEAGDFDQAVRRQQQALEIAELSDTQRTRFEDRLKLY
jgi:hypothetical protein